jgi:hypothetical protein
VRHDFTASGTRRALRKAYEVIAARFGAHFGDEPEDEAPKVALLADDDFEATVFEEAPQAASVDTALNHIHDPEALDAAISSGTTGSAPIVPPPVSDETVEREPVAPPHEAEGAWTASALTAPRASPRASSDDWFATNVTGADPELSDDTGEVSPEDAPDESTSVQGTSTPTPSIPAAENAFVAGEIDVPAPRPGAEAPVDLTASSSRLGGSPEPADPDTGSRTPPIERRDSH